MNLELVLGMSCNNITSLSCDRNSSLVAHTASGVLVILDTMTNCQVKYFQLRRNTVSSAHFSPDGKLIVTGEIGFRPAVRVWKLRDGNEVATLYGHEFGIKSVLFCPTMKVIISVGLEHDNEVNVWAWPTKYRLATNKIVDVIKTVTFSSCGEYFITAGVRHFKFWYPKLTLSTAFQTAVPIVQPLYGRPGILGLSKHNTFIDVACGNGASADLVYTVTKSGGLVILNALDRHLKCHKNIYQFRGTCLKVQDQILFIGFSSGDIHMFNSLTLLHLAALPLPTFFEKTRLNGGGVLTMTFNPNTTLLTAAYQNSSMCIWDLQDAEHIKQKYMAVYHSKAIANFDMFTSVDPGGRMRETLVTVSHDSSVRIWGIIISNSICFDRLSILYTDASTPLIPESTESCLDYSGVITAVKVSPDRSNIVTGTKSGNICVYDRATYEHTLTVMAHNREVTCLAFHADSGGRTVLVSGSRDRLIHIMDVNNCYQLVNTLSIHSSSITVLTVCEAEDAVCLISCAADRTLSICTADMVAEGDNNARCPPYFHLSRCATIVSTASDIALELNTAQMAVGCQDGYIRVFDMTLLQERRMFRGCASEEGQIQKICLDPSGILLLTAASDRTINIINFGLGDILLVIAGHAKCVTGLAFTSQGGHVISTSVDGCVFVWRLSRKMLRRRREIFYHMQARRSEGHVKDNDPHNVVSIFADAQPHNCSNTLRKEGHSASHITPDQALRELGSRKGGSLERLVTMDKIRRSYYSHTDRSVLASTHSAQTRKSRTNLELREAASLADVTWNGNSGEVHHLEQVESPPKEAVGSQPGLRRLRENIVSCLHIKHRSDPKAPHEAAPRPPCSNTGSANNTKQAAPLSKDQQALDDQPRSSSCYGDSPPRVVAIEMQGSIIPYSRQRLLGLLCPGSGTTSSDGSDRPELSESDSEYDQAAAVHPMQATSLPDRLESTGHFVNNPHPSTKYLTCHETENTSTRLYPYVTGGPESDKHRLACPTQCVQDGRHGKGAPEGQQPISVSEPIRQIRPCLKWKSLDLRDPQPETTSQTTGPAVITTVHSSSTGTPHSCCDISRQHVQHQHCVMDTDVPGSSFCASPADQAMRTCMPQVLTWQEVTMTSEAYPSPRPLSPGQQPQEDPCPPDCPRTSSSFPSLTQEDRPRPNRPPYYLSERIHHFNIWEDVAPTVRSINPEIVH